MATESDTLIEEQVVWASATLHGRSDSMATESDTLIKEKGVGASDTAPAFRLHGD